MPPKPDKFIPALYGGIIISLVSSIPFVSFINCFCCAGILTGGALAVYFYKNNFTPDTPPFTSGDCLVVGALAGVIGAIAGTILSAIFTMMFGNVMIDFVVRRLQELNLNLPDEVWRALEEARNRPLGFGRFIFQFFPNLIIYSVFGLLGGLIGYSIFKPKNVMMPPPPMRIPPAA